MSAGKKRRCCDLCQKKRREGSSTCIGVYRRKATNGDRIEIRVKVCDECFGGFRFREDKEREAFEVASDRITARLQKNGALL